MHSEIGNLYQFIENEAARLEYPLSIAANQLVPWEQLQQEGRKKLRELLHYNPQPAELRPRTVERVDMGDYVREKVYFYSCLSVEVPCYVLIPKQADFPVPGVIALHDHGGMYYWGKEKIVEVPNEPPVLTEFKKRSYGGKSYATELVRQGYVVVVIDAFYFGERRIQLDSLPRETREVLQISNVERGSKEWIELSNSVAREREDITAKSLYLAGASYPGVLVWDDIRTVDYLCSRPEVDESRIGCLGLSVGGFRTAHLAALDTRVKVACVCGWMSQLRPLIKKHMKVHTWMLFVPGLYKYLDYPDVASLAIPTSLLILQGSRDPLFPIDAIENAIDKVQSAYNRAGFEDRFDYQMYDTVHEFNPEMQSAAFEWFQERL